MGLYGAEKHLNMLILPPGLGFLPHYSQCFYKRWCHEMTPASQWTPRCSPWWWECIVWYIKTLRNPKFEIIYFHVFEIHFFCLFFPLLIPWNYHKWDLRFGVPEKQNSMRVKSEKLGWVIMGMVIKLPGGSCFHLPGVNNSAQLWTMTSYNRNQCACGPIHLQSQWVRKPQGSVLMQEVHIEK